MVGLDRMPAGVDVDVAAGWDAFRGRMVLSEVRHWELVVSYGLQTRHERGCGAFDPGENQHPGEDARRHQKKLNGPKKSVKHVEAKQNWVLGDTAPLKKMTVFD